MGTESSVILRGEDTSQHLSCAMAVSGTVSLHRATIGGLLQMVHSEVKVAWSCPTICDPIDYTAHGILQARILEWVAVPFSRGSSQPMDRTLVSRIAGGFFTS